MKTKLGISVGMMAAATYLIGLINGNLALLLIIGYVFLCESDEWLKKSVVKALALSLAFSVVSIVINLIPNGIMMVDDLLNIFGGNFSIGFLSRIVNFIDTVLMILERLLMLGLAVLALDTKTIKLPVVDKMIEKHM